MPIIDLNKVIGDFEQIRDEYNREEMFELVRLLLLRLENITTEKRR